MIETSPDITKLAEALSKAQAKLDGAKKDANNPHFRSRYATLEAVVDAIKPIHDHGLSYAQFPGAVTEGAIEITTVLMHSSGQWMRSTMHVPLGKRDAQGVGSAVSYGRRYALMSVFGVPAEDDDGNAASAPQPARRAPPPPPPPPSDDASGMKDYDGFSSAIALCSSKEEMEETCEMHGMDAHSDPVAKRIVADHWRKINPSKRAA